MRAEMKVTNTDLVLLKQIQHDWGGKIRVKHNANRDAYTLYWSNLDAIKEVLGRICPFIVAKRELVALMQKYVKERSSGTRIRVTDRDRSIFERICVINRASRCHER